MTTTGEPYRPGVFPSRWTPRALTEHIERWRAWRTVFHQSYYDNIQQRGEQLPEEAIFDFESGLRLIITREQFLRVVMVHMSASCMDPLYSELMRQRSLVGTLAARRFFSIAKGTAAAITGLPFEAWTDGVMTRKKGVPNWWAGPVTDGEGELR